MKGAASPFGGSDKAAADRYERAKRRLDHDAAAELVDDLVSQKLLDDLVTLVIANNIKPIVVVPSPEYDPDEGAIDDCRPPTNAIPSAYASRLRDELDCDVDKEIVQVARPGRTKLKLLQRYLWQPRFAGNVSGDRPYIIADDVYSRGGTFAMLRSHIVANGGTVIAATALASRDGKDAVFPVAPQTATMVRSSYTHEIDSLWGSEVGHDIDCLTEGEAVGLLEWQRSHGVLGEPLFQRIRDRLAEAAAK